MSGLHYQIRLEPDMERFRFRGLAIITIEDADLSMGDVVSLDACELAVEYCLANGVLADFQLSASNQTLAIVADKPYDGTLTLEIAYEGQIGDGYRGLYRSRYENGGQVGWLISSQFQASDARRAFPCFDHPSRRGTFEISLLIERGLVAISNTEIAEIATLNGNKDLVRFARTPSIPTYLVFVGFGAFEFLEERINHLKLRVGTTPGKSRYGHFALEIAGKALRFCELHTGIEYPLRKCDLIAVPDSIGAMENFGALRHSEQLLLVYPGSTSQRDRVRVGTIIAHEMAHMWFGNLVSLADWRYLWLNEAFATFYMFAIIDHINPEWNVWFDFFSDAMQAAFERDALLNTIPIEMPVVQEAARDPAPTPSSAPIIYHKGAAVLNMLRSSIGQARFKKGIHHYLRTYLYGSVTSSQFWEAFDHAADRDNRAFAQTWISQPGFPLLIAEREDNRLILRQERFTFLPHDSELCWDVPVEILLVRRDGRAERRSERLNQKELTYAIPPDTIAFKLNHNQTGFYRVQYEEANWTALGRLVEEQRLSAGDSFGLQNDLFVQVKRGDCRLDDYLGYIERHYREERRYLPLLDIVRNLLWLHLLLPRSRARIACIGREKCEYTLRTIGMEPQEQERHQTALIRKTLLWAAYSFGSEDVAQFGYHMFSTLLAGQHVPVDSIASVLKLGAATHPGALRYLLEQLAYTGLDEAVMVSYLEALSGFQEEDKLLQALVANLRETPNNLKSHAILAMTHNPVALSFLWDWFVRHLTELRALHRMQFERLLAGIIPVCGLGREQEVTAFCNSFSAKDDSTADSITMALEKLAINSRLRKFAEAQLAI